MLWCRMRHLSLKRFSPLALSLWARSAGIWLALRGLTGETPRTAGRLAYLSDESFSGLIA